MIAPGPVLPRLRPVLELPASPWRNGGGSTRLIASAAARAGAHPAWRISVATVTDGARFSSFPEYERTFLPLEADSVTLVAPGGAVCVGADGGRRFSGGEAVGARVPGGVTLALNVMTIPGRAESILRRHVVSGSYAISDPEVRASICVRGSVGTPDGDPVAAPVLLPAGVTVSATEAEILEVLIRTPADETGPEAG